MSMLLRERTKGQSETASDSRSRSRFRAAPKTKAATTQVEIRPLNRKAEVINPLNGESEGLRPTRITLDTAEPTVEIQLMDSPLINQSQNCQARQRYHRALMELLEMTGLTSSSTSKDAAIED